jgi:hypothetical protein
MAYTISIRRANGAKIGIQEWIDYISKDPDFELIQTYKAKSESGLEMNLNIPHSGLWSKHGATVPFTYRERQGTISVDRPNEITIEKMKQVAVALEANVAGEEGEIY